MQLFRWVAAGDADSANVTERAGEPEWHRRGESFTVFYEIARWVGRQEERRNKIMLWKMRKCGNSID